MATYYCDLGADTWVDRTGADGTTNVLTGPGGLRAAITGEGNATALAAGDTLYLKGTADLGRLVKLTIADTTGWLLGHSLSRAVGGGGTNWGGHICSVISGTQILVWLASDYDYNDITTADGVLNIDISDTETCSAKSCPGIVYDGAGGDTTTGSIKFIGCDGDWVARGAQAVLDGESLATYCLDCEATDTDFLSWVNVTFRRATSHNIYGPAATRIQNSWVFDHCLSELAGGDGLIGRFHGGIFTESIFRLNGSDGLDNSGQAYTRLALCLIHGNGGYGINAPGASGAYDGCLFYDNTSGGLSTGSLCGHFNCVFDGTDGAGDGIYISTTARTGLLILGCRFTNMAGMGINAPAYVDESTLIDYCVFYDNVGANIDTGLTKGPNCLDETDGVDNDGYTPTTDYNVASGEEHRSTEIVLNWAT